MPRPDRHAYGVLPPAEATITAVELDRKHRPVIGKPGLIRRASTGVEVRRGASGRQGFPIKVWP